MCVEENPILTPDIHKALLLQIAEGKATPSLLGRLSRHNAGQQKRIKELENSESLLRQMQA